MRKYYRAALTIIASVSIVALLLYRHEYNKLRYVLEVLNYFGNPSVKAANCSDASIASLSKLYDYSTFENVENDTNYADPAPAWQRLTDEIYVYSAHLTKEGEIHGVALAKSRRGKIALGCAIFFENEIDPSIGVFAYKLIDSASLAENLGRKSDAYQGYRFVCEYERAQRKRVAAIKFWTGNEAVLLAVRERSDNVESDRPVAGVCVAMSNSKPPREEDMLNFASFHSALGFERFVIYDFGVLAGSDARIKRTLRLKAAKTSSRISYTAIAWNFPFAEVPPRAFVNILLADCLYRTRGTVDILVALTWDEYIVLKHHPTIVKLFADFSKTEYTADRYAVSSFNFCEDKKRNNSLAKNILVREKLPDSSRRVHIYRRPRSDDGAAINADLVTRETSTDLIIVNRYEERCKTDVELETVSVDDRYVGKFAKGNTTLWESVRTHGL